MARLYAPLVQDTEIRYRPCRHPGHAQRKASVEWRWRRLETVVTDVIVGLSAQGKVASQEWEQAGKKASLPHASRSRKLVPVFPVTTASPEDIPRGDVHPLYTPLMRRPSGHMKRRRQTCGTRVISCGRWMETITDTRPENPRTIAQYVDLSCPCTGVDMPGSHPCQKRLSARRAGTSGCENHGYSGTHHPSCRSPGNDLLIHPRSGDGQLPGNLSRMGCPFTTVLGLIRGFFLTVPLVSVVFSETPYKTGTRLLAGVPQSRNGEKIIFFKKMSIN